ncbi:MAG: CheY-like chemotaxis protein, partial [Kiritimatiellia bacterium]
PEMLDDAMDALERIHNILQDLSQFRTAKDDVAPYELGPLIQKVVSGARLGLGNLRIIVLNLPNVVVQAQRARLLQVFANLLTNAWHAVERQGYGEVRVHGEVVGDVVRIYVDDDGPGIPTSKHDRIFEAFVTTKRVGKGSGLGLPVSRGMLRAMDGDLYCEKGSVLGGTRMTIQLSLAPRTAIPVALPERMSPPAHRHVQRAGVRPVTPTSVQRRRVSTLESTRLDAQLGTVLVVDDDPSIRKVISRTLRQHWHVLLASGSAEARQILRQEHVDVVLCDMHLAQEDALDVITVVENTRRSLLAHLVFMSGEPTSGRLVMLATANPNRCLGKPFHLNAVLKLLDAAHGGKLPPLELGTDESTPVAVIEPAWSFDLPTEELDLNGAS